MKHRPLIKPGFKPGTRVRLVDDPKRRVAVIQSRHDKYAEGAVFVLPPLDGYRWWNVEDLRRA